MPEVTVTVLKQYCVFNLAVVRSLSSLHILFAVIVWYHLCRVSEF